jgi:hypothetical protein
MLCIIYRYAGRRYLDNHERLELCVMVRLRKSFHKIFLNLHIRFIARLRHTYNVLKLNISRNVSNTTRSRTEHLREISLS